MNNIKKLKKCKKMLMANSNYLFIHSNDFSKWFVIDELKPIENHCEILNNENTSVNELYEFAKKHRKYNVELIISKLICFYTIVIAISNIILLMNGNRDLKMPNYLVCAILISIDFILFYTSNQNTKADMLYLKKKFERNDKKDA